MRAPSVFSDICKGRHIGQRHPSVQKFFPLIPKVFWFFFSKKNDLPKLAATLARAWFTAAPA
jgi:hypothetical protein